MIEQVERTVSPANAASVLKALLSGHEIVTEKGTFKYFKKGDWIPISEDSEGEVAESGIFKRCEIHHHSHHYKPDVIDHIWLFWLSSLNDFLYWVEDFSPTEMTIINANLVISQTNFPS